MYSFLQGKSVLLGVSASVAIYKTIELARQLRRMRIKVYIVMTENAAKLVSPQLFEAVSGHTVLVGQFGNGKGMSHIEIVSKVDLFVICPATANVIAKCANGFADDLLSTIFLSATCPVVFCPAMNVVMWENAVVQQNVQKLQRQGVSFWGPVEGELACGDVGPGKLIGISEVEWNIMRFFAPQDFAGKQVVITAGGTREWLDSVRFVSNASSGKMGCQLANAAALRGATVQLVSGATAVSPPFGVHQVNVEGAQAMQKAVFKFFPQADVIISAAAVSDYRPVLTARRKRAKNGQDWVIRLKENEDILLALSRKRAARKLPVLVGFSLEDAEVIGQAFEKLKRKKIDLIVANTPEALGSDEALVCLLDKSDLKKTKLPLFQKVSKQWIAWHILDAVLKQIRSVA